MRLWCSVVCLTSMLVLTGCGADVGECNELTLGGPTVPGEAVPYPGQMLMAQSCAGGGCHSEFATGDARRGAPAGLDFDVTSTDALMLSRAASTVREHTDAIWGEVEGGTMPPPAPEGGGELNAADKETLRNWLACGARVSVGATPTDPWEAIYETLGNNCISCHGSTNFMGSGGGFFIGDDACSAYGAMVSTAAVTASCVGNTLIVPGDPASSLLVSKLTATPACGSPMPLGTMGLGTTQPALLQSLSDWITAGALKPASCP